MQLWDWQCGNVGRDMKVVPDSFQVGSACGLLSRSLLLAFMCQLKFPYKTRLFHLFVLRSKSKIKIVLFFSKGKENLPGDKTGSQIL
jgi:hypothetical protein